MAMPSHVEHHRAHAAHDTDAPRDRSLGEHIFIWCAWALAAFFWGATFTTFGGILEAVARPTPAVVGGVDFGGVGFLVMDVVGGLLVLGALLAWGSWMYARRDRRLDPLTEAKTAQIYNSDQPLPMR